MPGVKLEDEEEFKFKIYGSGHRPYALDLIGNKIREIKPNVFGILLDTFMLHPNTTGQPSFFDVDFSPAKSVFYFPSDGGGGLPWNCENVLKKVDFPIAMSKYAQKQALELYGIKSEYIPHAVEPDIYRPLSQQEKFILRKNAGLLDKFVVGVVARNQPRKMLDRTIQAFKLVADKIPNAVLLMHCDKNDPAGQYFNMDILINQLNLNNRVIFTGMTYWKGFDYKKMNEVYNLFDVFFLGTSGEGFGIPTIEAMSCEIPVLVTDYTTTKELVTDNNCGEAIKISDEILGSWHVNRAIMDIKDAADKIIKLYNDPQLREQYGKNGRIAILREYSWPIVAKKWDEVLRKLL